MSSKRALITGVTGQDGSYLAELLLSKGYEVYGLTRRTSTPNHFRIANIVDQIHLLSGDLLDQYSLFQAIQESNPDEIYNLAAQSFVKASWEQPMFTGESTGLGVTRMLDAMRMAKPDAKFYQASSSEMFGKVQEIPQVETTPFWPRSPYGVAKVYGHWITVNYRESYDLFAVSGILFNHESPRRGLEFVTRKITNTVAKIKLGKTDKLCLGNPDAKRDWGYAKDYVEMMWEMLQADTPNDYVIATGETHSVREFVEKAFACAEINNWEDKVTWNDPRYGRPAEVEHLIGNPEKAKKELGWVPTTTFEDLVKIMVEADLKLESN
ncbi:MAG: GDP-mannose 4,6-dehydratase [bacterium]